MLSAESSPHQYTHTSSGGFVNDETSENGRVAKTLIKKLVTLGPSGWIKGPMGRSRPGQHADIKSNFLKVLTPGFVVSGVMCSMRGRGRIFRASRFTVLSITTFATLHCGAILRLNPGPIQRETMLSHLPFDPRAEPSSHPVEHPLFPNTKTTGLVEYIPDGIYLAQSKFDAGGVMCGLRTAIVRLNENSRDVLVYSPIGLTPSLEADLAEANLNVKFIVAPNLAHHLFVLEWATAFPDAKLIAPPVLPERRKDIEFHYQIESNDSEVPWDRSQIDFRVVPMGFGCLEIVLYHRSSKTMVVSDLIQNHGHDPEIEDVSRFSKVLWGSYGMTGRPVIAPYLLLALNDEPAPLTDAIHDIQQSWDFQRITLSHGRLVEVDAQASFADSMGFVEGEEWNQHI